VGSHEGKKDARKAGATMGAGHGIFSSGSIILVVKINEGKKFTKLKKQNDLPSSEFLGIQLRQKVREEQK